MKRLAVDELSLEGQPGAFAATLMNSSADLVARACRGDQDAFRLIFERYSRPVISFIYDLVGNRELAEELTQETFVRAFRSLRTLRAETKLSTWLFGIAKNVAREALRARARSNGHVDLADQSVLDLHDAEPVPVDRLLGKELNELIRRSLALLDDDKRLVFTLKVFQQCSYEEIAEITGFSLAKLKTDLHRARSEMRKRIGSYVGVRGVSNEV
jgi:RNA polymerase sigma-70 factor (ECF subfamily)